MLTFDRIEKKPPGIFFVGGGGGNYNGTRSLQNWLDGGGGGTTGIYMYKQHSIVNTMRTQNSGGGVVT